LNTLTAIDAVASFRAGSVHTSRSTSETVARNCFTLSGSSQDASAINRARVSAFAVREISTKVRAEPVDHGPHSTNTVGLAVSVEDKTGAPAIVFASKTARSPTANPSVGASATAANKVAIMNYLRLNNGDRDQEVTCFQKKLKVHGYKSAEVARAETEHAWQAVGAEKRQAVQALFGSIAGRYDLLNSAMSLRLHHRWRSEAVRLLQLGPGDTVADICCGTGDFGWPVRRAVGGSGRIVGIDFSLPMLEVGKIKAVPMSLGVGDACALPFSTGAFDAVTVGWGLRNVADLERALAEIRRVLKPGGRFVSLDMAKPRNPVVRAGSRLVFSLLAPALGTIFKRRDAYKYLPQSTENFAARDEQIAIMRSVGFAETTYKDMFLGNICVHWGKV